MVKKVTWNFQVPEPLNEAVEEAIEIDYHVTKAEFIRSAVREKLRQMGLITRWQKNNNGHWVKVNYAEQEELDRLLEERDEHYQF